MIVSNFNDKANVQGTGTTLVEVSPGGKLSIFAKIASLPAGMHCPGGIGLGTGLAILPGGWWSSGAFRRPGPRGRRPTATPSDA